MDLNGVFPSVAFVELPPAGFFRESRPSNLYHQRVKLRARLVWTTAVVLLIAYLADRWRRAHLEASQDRNILTASRKYGVEPALIKAVVWQESRFDPRAKGAKGETGLMQIMDDTGRDWAAAQRIPLFSRLILFDAGMNIDCGTWYLRKLLGRYQRTDNPVPYALADYNAGRGNVLKWLKAEATTNSAAFIEQIGFPSTRTYVRSVMERREHYVDQFQDRR